MGLVGMMARTAVVAGTATAVSNRVSRRQVNRWNNKAEQEQQQQPQQEQYQQAPPAAPPPPAAPAGGSSDLLGQLKELSTLKNAGVLSEDEFTAAKAKLLGT